MHGGAVSQRRCPSVLWPTHSSASSPRSWCPSRLCGAPFWPSRPRTTVVALMSFHSPRQAILLVLVDNHGRINVTMVLDGAYESSSCPAVTVVAAFTATVHVVMILLTLQHTCGLELMLAAWCVYAPMAIAVTVTYAVNSLCSTLTVHTVRAQACASVHL